MWGASAAGIIYLSEASAEERPWSEPLIALLLEMKQATDDVHKSGQRCVSRAQVQALGQRYELTVPPWERHQANPSSSALEAGPQFAAALTAAAGGGAADLRVPFDSNQAKRDSA